VAPNRGPSLFVTIDDGLAKTTSRDAEDEYCTHTVLSSAQNIRILQSVAIASMQKKVGENVVALQ
jgi:hypothetical protein